MKVSDIRDRLAEGLDPLTSDWFAWDTGAEFVVHNPAGSCPAATRSGSCPILRDVVADPSVNGGRRLDGCPDCAGRWESHERAASVALHRVRQHREKLAAFTSSDFTKADDALTLLYTRMDLEHRFAHGPLRGHPLQGTPEWRAVSSVELVWQWWSAQIEDLEQELSDVVAAARRAHPAAGPQRLVALATDSLRPTWVMSVSTSYAIATAEALGGVDGGPDGLHEQYAVLVLPADVHVEPFEDQWLELGPDCGPEHRESVRAAFAQLAQDGPVGRDVAAALAAALTQP